MTAARVHMAAVLAADGDVPRLRTRRGVDRVEAVIPRPDVDNAAVRAYSRARVHAAVGFEPPLLCAFRGVNGVEVVVVRPGVDGAAIWAQHRTRVHGAAGRDVPPLRDDDGLAGRRGSRGGRERGEDNRGSKCGRQQPGEPSVGGQLEVGEGERER